MSRVLKRTVSQFLDDNCSTMAAALAYYTTFSLPPLLLIIIAVVGLVVGRQAVQGSIQQQIQGLIGSGAAGQVETMVRAAGQHHSAGIVGGILGILALIFGATSAFAQLQSSLNSIWHVKPDPEAGGVRSFLVQRVLSFGMILAVAFLLLVSLAVSAALSALGGMIARYLPSGFSAALLQAIEVVMSLAIISALFAAIFKVLPDVRIEWRQVWAGALITALLFTAGKFLIGIYLGKSGAASAYGAAGSLVLIVLWIYYSSMILLVGAEFTRVWAEFHGRRVEPKKGAVRVIQQEQHERPRAA